MKQFFTLLIILCSVVLVKAQESAVFSHYYVYPILVNPGYTGMGEHQLLLNFKNSWTGFPGAPKDYAVSYNGPLNDQSGIGVQLFSEKIASVNINKAQVNYAYHFEVNKFKIGAGMSGEFQSQKIDGVSSDPLTAQNDEILSDAQDGFKIFDVSFGVFAQSKGGVYFGFTLPNMIRTRLDQNIIASKEATDPFQNYTLNLGVKHRMPDYGIILEPSVMIRSYRSIPVQVDANILASILEERVFGGISYRAGRTGRGGLLAGVRYGFGTLMYSFNYSFQKLQDYSGGGHELSVKFNLNNALGKEELPKAQ